MALSEAATTEVTPDRPATVTGVDDGSVVPSPSSPDPLAPQHDSVPLLAMAHIEAPFCASAVTPDSPGTWVGVRPSWVPASGPAAMPQ